MSDTQFSVMCEWCLRGLHALLLEFVLRGEGGRKSIKRTHSNHKFLVARHHHQCFWALPKFIQEKCDQHVELQDGGVFSVTRERNKCMVVIVVVLSELKFNANSIQRAEYRGLILQSQGRSPKIQ